MTGMMKKTGRLLIKQAVYYKKKEGHTFKCDRIYVITFTTDLL